MNSCILMAEIIQDPQLRYTADNQTAIAEMMVQFEGLRPEDPPETLRVVGWGNLAQEIQQTYHQGDRVVIEGRLTMNSIERPEGFREKRAELTVQRIHGLGVGAIATSSLGSTSSTAATTSSPAAAPKSKPAARSAAPARSSSEPAPAYAPPSEEPADYDDIPF